jgi:hypothetical protein
MAGSDASAAQHASPATVRRASIVSIMLSPLKSLLSPAVILQRCGDLGRRFAAAHGLGIA